MDFLFVKQLKSFFLCERSSERQKEPAKYFHKQILMGNEWALYLCELRWFHIYLGNYFFFYFSESHLTLRVN